MAGTAWTARRAHCGHLRGSWGPLNIAAMIGGFIIYWPLGLAVLAYNMFAQPGDFSRWVDQVKSWLREHRGPRHHRRADQHPYGATGNAAFDEYRSRMMHTLDEERQRLEAEVQAFRQFQEDLRRTHDREEFDRFMAEKRPRR